MCLIPLAIASSISSLEMVAALNFFFIGDCPISLFRSPLTVEVFMMNPMQNVLKFTDRIIKYLANSAERKTTRASRSEGHVISGEGLLGRDPVRTNKRKRKLLTALD